ncbi:MAG: Fic family protein [Clostridiales Family XIII bacterium]|nr:Fic family protein [Clostridiales Family XIII bacterium]
MKRPFPEVIRITVDKLDLFDFTYTDLKLEGSSLTHEGVSRIIDGGFVPEISLAEHGEADRRRTLLKEFAFMIDMDITIDVRQLVKLYGILTDDKTPEFRRVTPALFHLDYTPPYYSEVEEGLEALFRNIYGSGSFENYIERAAALHDGIVRVYPFEEKSEMLARTALQYELMHNGLPIVQIGLSEQEYNKRLSTAIKTGDHSGIYEAVLQSADHKLDLLLGLF